MTYMRLFSLMLLSSVTCAIDIDCFAWSRTDTIKLHDDSVYGLEGSYIGIQCNVASHEGPCTCTPAATYTIGNFQRIIYNIIYTKSLETEYAGDYTITCPGGKRTIQLHVLYPPVEADIQGPYTIENGSPLNLTCDGDSYPPARYWWKYDISEDSPVIATGATLSIPALQHEDTWVYCFAQNTMDPTFGPPVTKPPIHVARHLVIKQDPAHIRDLPDKFTTHSGLTISIDCEVDGIPTPTVWWTKESDESFMQTGNRLTAVNVKTEFSGIYHCNAQNMVMQNGTDYTATDSRAVFVKVSDPPGTYHIVAAVGASLVALVLSGSIAIVVFCVVRKRKMATSRRADNESLVPSVRLSTIMSHEEPGTSEQNGPASNQPTENTCSSGSQQCHINYGYSSEETRRKSIVDTQMLNDVL